MRSPEKSGIHRRVARSRAVGLSVFRSGGRAEAVRFGAPARHATEAAPRPGAANRRTTCSPVSGGRRRWQSGKERRDGGARGPSTGGCGPAGAPTDHGRPTTKTAPASRESRVSPGRVDRWALRSSPVGRSPDATGAGSAQVRAGARVGTLSISRRSRVRGSIRRAAPRCGYTKWSRITSLADEWPVAARIVAALRAGGVLPRVASRALVERAGGTFPPERLRGHIARDRSGGPVAGGGGRCRSRSSTLPSAAAGRFATGASARARHRCRDCGPRPAADQASAADSVSGAAGSTPPPGRRKRARIASACSAMRRPGRGNVCRLTGLNPPTSSKCR